MVRTGTENHVPIQSKILALPIIAVVAIAMADPARGCVSYLSSGGATGGNIVF